MHERSLLAQHFAVLLGFLQQATGFLHLHVAIYMNEVCLAFIVALGLWKAPPWFVALLLFLPLSHFLWNALETDEPNGLDETQQCKVNQPPDSRGPTKPRNTKRNIAFWRAFSKTSEVRELFQTFLWCETGSQQKLFRKRSLFRWASLYRADFPGGFPFSEIVQSRRNCRPGLYMSPSLSKA